MSANDNTVGSATNLGNITINSAITTNGGAISLQNSGGIGGIAIDAPIVTDGGAIDIRTTNSSIQLRGNLSSSAGNINVIGNSPSTGIQIDNSAKISTTSGTITLNGTGSNTIDDRVGLSIIGDSSVEITSVSGNINLIGNVPNTLGASGIEFLSFVTSSASVSAGNSVKVQTTSGNINITGNTANPTQLGIRIPNPIGILTIDSGLENLTFISDKSLFPNTAFTGLGSIALQPFNNDPLVLNSNVTNASGSAANVFADSSFFNILTASSSFSNVRIGSPTTSNPITVASFLFNLNKPIIIQSPLGAGSINTSGFDLVNTGGSITLLANQNITTGNIRSTGNAISIISNLGAIDTSLGIVDSRALGPTGNGGNITYQAFGNIRTGNIGSLGATGNGGSISLITTNGAIDTSLGNIDSGIFGASGNAGNIIYQAFGNITTGNISSSLNVVGNAGEITLTSVNGSVDTVEVVATSSGGNGGNIIFNSPNGNFSNGNGINANTNSASASSTAGSLTINALNTTNIGSINLSANVGTAGDINLSGNLPLTSSTTFSTTSGGISGNINLGNAIVTGSQSLTLNAGTGNVALGSVGNILAPLSTLTVISGNTTLNNDIFTTNALNFNSPVVLSSGVSLNTTNSAIAFNNTIDGNQDLTINSGNGNVIFNRAIASSAQPLGNLTVNSTGTVTFASTVFANSISSNVGGDTIINADLVATGADGFISLGNFTANGNISLVGNEIDLEGIALGTGDLTLKPLAVNQQIAISGNEDTGISILDIQSSDLNAFVNGTFNSLTIGNLNGSGTVFLLGDANFFQPTTLQAPVGNGAFFSNGFNIAGVGRLGIDVGNAIAINNATLSPRAGSTLNVRLNADRDASGSGTISLFNSTINTGGQNITLGGGLNPVIDPAIASGNSAGVAIDSSTLDAEGGNIFVNGRNTSTLGTNNNGILITRASTTQPISQLLTSGLGTITLVGTNTNVGLNNSDGISIEAGTVIKSVDGNISLVGVGGNGSTLNDGIEIEGNSLIRTTGTGSISLVGDTLSTAIDNRDVNVLGSIIETLGTGAILIASSPSTPRLLQIANSSINPTAVGGSGTVTLESEAIELLGSTQIKGAGQLLIQPTFSSTGIRLGGAINDANLNLSSAELATIQDGFSQILIGRLDSAGQILLADNLSFSDPITLRSQGTGGSINTSGFDFTSTGAISFLANQNITTGNVTTLGNNLTLSSSLGAINSSQGLLDTSNTSGSGGNISLLSPSINTNLGSINTSSTVGNAGNLSFANISNGLITIAGSDINLSSETGVAGSLNFLAPVVIDSSNLTINTYSSSGVSGAVTFSNNLNGAIANANSLTVNAGSGNITFNAIGNNIALGDLAANTSGQTNFNGVAIANSLSTDVGGTTTLNGDISTIGSQIYDDAVSLTANSLLRTINNDITFNGTVNGTQALTLNAGSGNITFGSTVGLISTVGNIIANSSALTTFNGTVNAGAVTTDSGGATDVKANITTAAAQTYGDDVNLSAATIFTANNAAITFNGNINGNQAIRVLSGTADINFNGTLNTDNIVAESGGITRFNTVNAVGIFTDDAGTTELNGNITTTGAVIFNDAVNLANPIQLNTGAIAFNKDITGNQDLTISSGSNSITFGGTTTVNNLIANSTGSTRFSSSVNAASITTDVGGNTLLIGNVTTSGNQTYNDNLLINANTILDSSAGNGTLSFAGIQNAIAGTSSNLTLNAGTGSILFNNAAGSLSDRLGNVTISTANPDIRGAIIASQITLTPSVANSSIAIGSVANGDFKLQDSALNLLQADLVKITANGSAVNIGNASFATGTSLEIGTASSPATSISATAGSTLNVDRNLSLTANTIQFSNTNVGGNLDLRFTDSVSQIGAISVIGATNLAVDSNPLTNVLLADFANSFGNQISFTFINLPNSTLQNLEIRDITDNARLALVPDQVNNLKLILDNGTIDLSTIPLTDSLTLQGRQVSINGDIKTTNANISGGQINLNSNLTTLGNLTINNTDTLKIATGTNLDITGNLEQTGNGAVQLGGNIVRAASVSFAQNIELIGNISITSDGNINFDKSVDGGFAFTLDANGNFVVAKGGFGTNTPLQSLAISPNSTLVSQANSRLTPTDINVVTAGNVNVANITNKGSSINISSTNGAIATGDIDSSFAVFGEGGVSIGNGGNVSLSAEGNVTTGNIATNSLGAGAVNLESRSGAISTGDVNASGNVGGRVFFNAATAINAGRISTRGLAGAGGNVTLDPSGDVVVAAIDTSGLTGGNVTLVSTGGNLRITDVLGSGSLAACQGASICTIGSTASGTISLRTGGLNPFAIGDASVNGSKGFLTTGQSTLTLGTSIPALVNQTFLQNGISITPGGFIVVPVETHNNTSVSVETHNNTFIPPVIIPTIEQPPLIPISPGGVFIQAENKLVTELEQFTGKAIKSEEITVENTQDLLSTVTQQTGDVAALIYPVIFNNRIEVLVIPPKEKGKPFLRSSIPLDPQQIETVVTDYRNNLRDVGSNDYLEQSQQIYDWIIRPIRTEIEAMKIDTLVFVMDGGLRVTPPSALHDGKQFLIENFAIASIPSLRVTRIEERDRRATRVLAMGLTESVAGFSALPSVDIEIKTISSEVLNGDAFFNQEFTVKNLQAQRQSGIYNILHLGTHAKFVSDTSKDSFIQFWDSRLSLSDIPQLRLDSPAIDMLTLSACQTAVGNNLGISGLAVESGAKSVLASLWEVSDAGTAPLMISFYKAFPEAANKAQAMRQAQIELLAGRVTVGDGKILGIDGISNVSLPEGITDIDLRHPFYWSSFILVGNWL
ncbi:MAG: hypothetical protein AUK48_06405 [Oscillatoriales cyanobacterium CG2_30_44_21]|nr:MAG: hypothetical protein AUK48_06405 [Oscillatoriales cyanobacterium CG2_30_44_21]